MQGSPPPRPLQGVDAAALMAAAEARERKGSGLTVGGPSAQQDVLQVHPHCRRQLPCSLASLRLCPRPRDTQPCAPLCCC